MEREQIDWSALLVLSKSDLKDLGLPIGQRAKFAAALRSLQDRDASVANAISNAPLGSHNIKVQLDVEGARRQLTVMFCDLVGATELSSKLDPEELRELVRAYEASCEEEVTHFEGHIAQYLGDGLPVYFGHPKAHEDDAARAVRTGLGILDAMQVLNERLRLSLSVRIGIHTGLVVLGKVGAGERQETLALGDVPNVAARLQNIAVPDSVLISAATQKLVEGLFESQSLGC
jgi:class 3 adenylate cyclase